MADLDGRLDDWVDAGLIERSHAEAIRTHERERADEPGRSRAAEALGYVGGALAFTAIAVVVGEFWEELTTWARLALVAVVTAWLYVGGWWLARREDVPSRRLGSVLWALSAAGVSFVATIAMDDLADTGGRTVALVAGAVGAAYALPLWLRRRTPLQQLALFSGALTALIAGTVHVPHLEEEFVALTVWGAGVVWGLVTWAGIVGPRRTGFAVAALTSLGGAQVAAVTGLGGWGYGLGLVTALTLIAVSLPIASLLLLGFGAAGVFVFVTGIAFEYFADEVGAPVALLISGLTLVGAAVLIGRLRRELDDHDGDTHRGDDPDGGDRNDEPRVEGDPSRA